MKHHLQDNLETGRPIIGTPYRVGDPLGYKWVICDLIGIGGMGVVFLVYDKDVDSLGAIKSFREEFLQNPVIRNAFRREAEIWISLEQHPYIVEATWIEEVSGRLYVEMDYIPPQKGMKSCSLDAYLMNGPLKENIALDWAIQFCHGIEHAYSHGISCHRDIKPQNILIDSGILVRISDFGLSKALDGTGLSVYSEIGDIKGLMISQAGSGGCGTPPYMPPEQFERSGGDVRNDIYSFGVVLYEMLTGSVPFFVELPRSRSPEAMRQYWNEWHKVHREKPVPHIKGRLGDVVEKCLAKDPRDRYASFAKVRDILSNLYGSIITPFIPEPTIAWYVRKGACLHVLGLYKEAIEFFDKALEINPQQAEAWGNKGNSLKRLGRYEEAQCCYDKAIEIDPSSADAWFNKGSLLMHLGQYEESLSYFDKALHIDPMHVGTRNNKGISLKKLGRYREALSCTNEALAIDGRYAEAWYSRGQILRDLGQYQEAITSYDKAIDADPSEDAVYYDIAEAYLAIGSNDRAIEYYKFFIARQPVKYVSLIDRAIRRIKELER